MSATSWEKYWGRSEDRILLQCVRPNSGQRYSGGRVPGMANLQSASAPAAQENRRTPTPSNAPQSPGTASVQAHKARETASTQAHHKPRNPSTINRTTKPEEQPPPRRTTEPRNQQPDAKSATHTNTLIPRDEKANPVWSWHR